MNRVEEDRHGRSASLACWPPSSCRQANRWPTTVARSTAEISIATLQKLLGHGGSPESRASVASAQRRRRTLTERSLLATRTARSAGLKVAARVEGDGGIVGHTCGVERAGKVYTLVLTAHRKKMRTRRSRLRPWSSSSTTTRFCTSRGRARGGGQQLRHFTLALDAACHCL